MTAPKAVQPKTAEEMARQWDALALRRHQQIASGQDLSFTHVLVPLVAALLRPCDSRRILDIGCGTGELTTLLAEEALSVVAIDPSEGSLQVARRLAPADRVEFVHTALERAETDLAPRDFSVAVAAMTLMTVSDLSSFSSSLASILQPGSHFVATMAHPWFWPRYWKYDDKEWFSYSEELFIEAPFKISLDRTELPTTHVHRPLEAYIRAFAKAGFVLESLLEPMPSADVQDEYGKPWEHPRFLGIRWRLVGEG